MFKLAPVTVAADGTITLKGVKPETMYTLTTLSTGSKGKAGSTATQRAAFPFILRTLTKKIYRHHQRYGTTRWEREVQEDESKKETVSCVRYLLCGPPAGLLVHGPDNVLRPF